ncbi:hypothetical protein HLPR_04600 [Helicovermis profundi]|uniref:Leucine-rich repeat domain-containing protein n=1 Tax=Helicovermis profundi TaxID=3065157 RepID=A0AAU9EA31_9FIRM|nr:hypothetical protein HLPR_04600 [Clostridia bacterium S502]
MTNLKELCANQNRIVDISSIFELSNLELVQFARNNIDELSIPERLKKVLYM